MAADILIVVETAQGKLPAAALELITAGAMLRAQTLGRLAAVSIGTADPASIRALIGCGVDQVYCANDAAITEQVVEARLAPIIEACARIAPRIVLLSHGVAGAELAPRLAFRLNGAVVTGCVEVVAESDRVLCTRPCYGGIARETAAYAVAPLVATLRAGVTERAAEVAGREGEVVMLAAAGSTRTRIVERKLEAGAGVRLEDARVIVAGGRGLEGAEGFRVLEALATALDAAVGASRVPCDLGWCPHSWQIGLTGKTVTPELYIAVGISGAGHHMAGCGNAKTIVAINTDPEAAIFQDARFGVVGDYREVVPALTAAVKKMKQEAG